MDQLGLTSNVPLVASLLLLLSMLWMRQRQVRAPQQRAEDRLDTVQAWPVQLVRAMTPPQRKAYDLLRQALPGHLILVQTPLAQFMRVSTRYSYAEWHKRAGRLRVGLVVCDDQSNVLAAIDLRLSNETDREQARHARLVRVLESAGTPVLIWAEAALPGLSQVRERFASLLTERTQSARGAGAVTLEPGTQMSGALEAMSVESTDFAVFDTAPAPFDERPGSDHTERSASRA